MFCIYYNVFFAIVDTSIHFRSYFVRCSISILRNVLACGLGFTLGGTPDARCRAFGHQKRLQLCQSLLSCCVMLCLFQTVHCLMQLCPKWFDFVPQSLVFSLFTFPCALRIWSTAVIQIWFRRAVTGIAWWRTFAGVIICHALPTPTFASPVTKNFSRELWNQHSKKLMQNSHLEAGSSTILESAQDCKRQSATRLATQTTFENKRIDRCS